MNLIKRTAAAVLIVTLLLSGCAGGNTTWAYKSNDAQMPTGLYIIYEISSIAGLSVKISEENPETASTAAPQPSELLKMTVGGQPATQWVDAETQKNVREYFAIKQKFESMGMQLSEGEISSIDYNVKSIMSQNQAFYDKIGVSEASLKEFYAGIVRKGNLFNALYGEGGEFAVPVDEVKGQFEKDYIMLDAIPFYKPYGVPEGETKTMAELEADVKAKAEEYFKRLQAGGKIEDLAYDWQLENTPEEEKVNIEKPSEGDLRVVVTEDERANFGDSFIDAAFESKIGVPVLVEEVEFYVIFNRVDIMSDEEVFDSYKGLVLQDMRGEEYNTKLLEWALTVAMEPNAATLEKYKPTKLKLDDANI